MFYGCVNLEELDVSSFDTSNVTFLDQMFQDCVRLEELDVSGFNTKSSKSFQGMFQNCTSLKYIDLSLFDFSSNKTGNRDLLDYCDNLMEIKAPIDFANDEFYIPLPGTFYDVDSGVECVNITQTNAGHTLKRK